jgi:hypothetical protein
MPNYLLFDKKTQKGKVADLIVLASILEIGRDTIRKRLPFWESKDWMLCRCEIIKSKRGGKLKNLKS